jgi:hypothetical protein
MDIAADLQDRFWVVELGLLEKREAHGLLPDGKSILMSGTKANTGQWICSKPVEASLSPICRTKIRRLSNY